MWSDAPVPVDDLVSTMKTLIDDLTRVGIISTSSEVEISTSAPTNNYQWKKIGGDTVMPTQTVKRYKLPVYESCAIIKDQLAQSDCIAFNINSKQIQIFSNKIVVIENMYSQQESRREIVYG